MKKEMLHFKVNSPENTVKLLATIMFENNSDNKKWFSLWEDVFNKDDKKGDALFKRFLEELFPQGKTITKTEVKLIVEHALKFLKCSDICQEERIKYKKRNYENWVYSKWNKLLMPCQFGEHAQFILSMCINFFWK